MKTTAILKRAHIENKEFLTGDDLRLYCKEGKFDYKYAVKYLVERGYLVRIFRGIFYVKGSRAGIREYDRRELVGKGMELKGVKDWYFALYSALKLNNMTHEHFTTEYVINDFVFRPTPMRIAGYKFKFLKITPKLLDFGIKGKIVRYSDAEKTILDFIYVWQYNSVPPEKILMDVSEWAEGISKVKIRRYSTRYPKSVGRIVERMYK